MEWATVNLAFASLPGSSAIDVLIPDLSAEDEPTDEPEDEDDDDETVVCAGCATDICNGDAQYSTQYTCSYCGQVFAGCCWAFDDWDLCDNCHSDQISCCEGCGETYHIKTNGMWCDYGQHYVCDACWSLGDHGFCPPHAEQYEQDDDYDPDEDDSSGPPCSSFGGRTTLPWVDRAEDVDWGEGPIGNQWREAWGFDVKEIIPAVAAADFYLCQGMANGALARDRDLEFFVNAARDRIDTIVAQCDPVFMRYADMAIGGELRYHRLFGQYTPYGKDRERHWTGWRVLRDRLGPAALIDAADLFDDFLKENGIKTGYGGPKWADCARTLHARVTNQISPETFVDRVFSLQHNGGSLLNKLEWGGNVGLPSKRHLMRCVSRLQSVIGPAHSENLPCWDELAACATPEVRILWGRYVIAANRVRVSQARRPAYWHTGTAWFDRVMEVRNLDPDASCSVFEADMLRPLLGSVREQLVAQYADEEGRSPTFIENRYGDRWDRSLIIAYGYWTRNKSAFARGLNSHLLDIYSRSFENVVPYLSDDLLRAAAIRVGTLSPLEAL